MQRKVYILENLDCANCAAKIERKLSKLPELNDVSVTFATKQLRFEAEDPEAVLPKIRETIQSMEPDVEVVERTRGKCKTADHHHEHHAHEHGHEEGCGCGHDHHEHEHSHDHHDHHAHEHGHEEGCGCGHDYHEHEHSHEHHHDHGDECGCGHDHHDHEHSHEHHHDHGDGCGCGHDHDHHEHSHEHHHDHGDDCCCGHEHHHEPSKPQATRSHTHFEVEYHHVAGHPDHCDCSQCNSYVEYCDVCGESLAKCTCHMPDEDLEKKVYILEGIDCANCAAKIEAKIRQMPEVGFASVAFATKQLRVSANNQAELLPKMQAVVDSIEDGVTIVPRQRKRPTGISNTKIYILEGLDCANCAAKMEEGIKKISGVKDASVSFMTQKLVLEADDDRFDEIMKEVVAVCAKVEPDCKIEC